jgi:NAD(P)-dependent dehydrogenase (short-subunit alcohol dehydrogenase family)
VVDVFNAFARAAGAPRVVFPADRRLFAPAALAAGFARRLPGADALEELLFEQLAIPREVLPHISFPTVFDSSGTEAALAGPGIEVPRLEDYAGVLWHYWADHLDRNRHRRPRAGGPLAGRRVLITGASSGIGRATAIKVARERGVPLLVARRGDALDEVKREIEREGGLAHIYPCDLTSDESIDALIKTLLTDHEGVDMVVNNAGRSIRRSVRLSYDRFHDYERTMALNYFAPVRLILGLLPHMTERRFGHIVNISSIGVQANPPRFSAYVASKAALDAFSRVVASETYGDGITFTTVHMPLVRTPMIRPTKMYDAFPASSPEDAADMVLQALRDRPKEVGTRLGTMAEVLYATAPKLVDQLLHVAYQTFPDSKAATGDAGDASSREASLSQLARNLTKLLPGVHW